ncbi:4-hydroxyphenylpyruvate dioxygenase [Baaleninema sp.]|uniref:4-hydroxyphenylpyruvate dioxygenase n=1 Tax=Baaleninema sp. TaxID=3101197 RepID=UPI003D031342
MVQIDHVHFYVEDAKSVGEDFVKRLGFQAVGEQTTDDTHMEILQTGGLRFLLSSPLKETSSIAAYLRRHPPGVADVAFRVRDLDEILDRLVRSPRPLSPFPILPSPLVRQGERCNQIAAWGSLRHTLIEGYCEVETSESGTFEAIDHLVLNVESREFAAAANWYCEVFGFVPQQQFSIATDRSSLHSQVLVHPETGVQFPINKPTSENSQIQEFLDFNGGAGLQHIALKTSDILTTVPRMRRAGVDFLEVPETYFDRLSQKPGFNLNGSEFQILREQEILVDWKPSRYPAFLLQTFTKPVFKKPTFFFEVIERRTGIYDNIEIEATGFGEGNFKALFEAIERQQIQRNSV